MIAHAPIRFLAIAALVAAGGTLPARAAEGARPVALLPESKLWLEGDSTLHPYKATATRWTLTASMAPDGGEQPALAALEAVVPVKALKSGDGQLDRNMYLALKAADHPAIRFRMTGNAVRVAPGGAVSAAIRGKLAVAGVENDVTLHAEGRLDGDVFRVAGAQPISMKAFAVEPPVLLLGAIRVADRIVVRYDLAVRRPAARK